LQTALLTSKFGMMPDEAFSAFRQYKDSSHLDICGIHLHIGSQNPAAAVYSEAFEMLFDSLLRIYNETGTLVRHINLGGGFPVNYLGTDGAGSGIAEGQRQMLGAIFEPADALQDAWNTVHNAAAAANSSKLLENLTLLIEPGRSVIADTGICLTTVRNHKSRPVSDPSRSPHPSSADNWLLTDAGFNILLSMETYKWYYHLISAERSGDKHDTPYKLAGPLCDGGDVYFDIEGERRLPDHRMLPGNARPGEVLALLNCGAYTLAQASQYNGRFLPAVVLIRENGELDLARRRDTFDDLITNDL
jgi:diaminopimelate decarboxylase